MVSTTLLILVLTSSAPAAEPVSWEEHAPAMQGKVVLVNFWATWCGPCRAELPVLDDLHDRLDPEAASVLAVNLDRQPARARALLGHLEADLPVIYDAEGVLAGLLEPPAMPSSFLLDASGAVQAVYPGSLHAGDLDRLQADIAAAVEGLPEESASVSSPPWSGSAVDSEGPGAAMP